MKSINDICFVVQSRLNSERLPKKMIKPFNNTTLLDIALQKLVAATSIPNNQVYLSVHEDELISIGSKYPINIFKRSYESANCDNGISTLFEWWNRLPYKYVILISACNPLLRVDTINQFVNAYLENDFGGMFGVVEKHNYFWDSIGNMLNVWPEGQDLLNTKAVAPTYEAAHCLYASKMDSIGKGRWVGTWTEKNDPALFTVHAIEAFDIDFEWQFAVAEQLHRLDSAQSLIS